jgi:hypothetical protein
MSEYENHIRQEVAEFISKLHNEFTGQYDYIESIDNELSIGLTHLEDYRDVEFNGNPLEVSIGIPGIDRMTEIDVAVLDADINRVADEEGVTVEQTRGNGTLVEYTFYLHAAFLGVNQ